MEIRTHITKSDLVEFHLFQLARSQRERARRIYWALLPPVAIAGVIFSLIAKHVAGPIRPSTLLPMVPIVPLYLVLLHRFTQRRLAQQVDRLLKSGNACSALGEYLITIGEEGITAAEGPETHFRSWNKVRRVVANGDYCYAFTDTARAIIVPRHSFSDEHAFRAFVKVAVTYHWHKESVIAQAAHAVAEAAAKAAVERVVQAGEPFVPAHQPTSC
jgi:hypothetical protein